MRVAKFAVQITLTVCAVLTLSSCSSGRSVVGSWKDVSEDYYVEFTDTNVYRDSQYNLELSYSEDNGNITYYTAAGDVVYVEQQWSNGGHLRTYIGGDYRELKRVDNVQSMYDWSSNERFRTRSAEEHYIVKSAMGVSSDLYLAEGNTYYYTVQAGETAAPVESQGLYAMSDNSRDCILYYNNGLSLDLLRVSPYGMYVGAFPMTTDGELAIETSYSNQSLNEARGYLIDGVVSTPNSGVIYTFDKNSKCLKMAPTGSVLSYTYYISTEGLVTLIPSESVLDIDYMYFDAEQNRFYRLVYQRDSWYDYLSELSAPVDTAESESRDWTVAASLSALSNRTDALPLVFVEGSAPQYSDVPTLDAGYTDWGCSKSETI